MNVIELDLTLRMSDVGQIYRLSTAALRGGGAQQR